MSKTFKCDNCGKVFESDWDGAEAEYEKEFGLPKQEPRAVVCDDCYNQIMAFKYAERQ